VLWCQIETPRRNGTIGDAAIARISILIALLLFD